MRKFLFLPALVCLTLLATTNINAQLTVTMDLGTLSTGTMAISGDTSTGTNQVDYYSFFANSNYGNENIYQFTVSEPVLFNVSSVNLTADPDFFLLNGLGTATDIAGKTFTTNAIFPFFLDAGPPEDGPFPLVLVPGGTYFLAAAAFEGVDGATAPSNATYDIQLSLTPAPPAPPAIDLGVIAEPDVAFTINTLASIGVNDTELAVWNEDGILIITNDVFDAPNMNYLSELDLFVGLPAGTYFLSVSGFNTVFGEGFVADSTSTQAGEYTLTFNGSTLTGNLTPGSVDFYSFEIGSGGLVGDVNLDGIVNFFDISPFIAVLSNNVFQFEADANGDGIVNFFDIQPFIDILAM